MASVEGTEASATEERTAVMRRIGSDSYTRSATHQISFLFHAGTVENQLQHGHKNLRGLSDIMSFPSQERAAKLDVALLP